MAAVYWPCSPCIESDIYDTIIPCCTCQMYIISLLFPGQLNSMNSFDRKWSSFKQEMEHNYGIKLAHHTAWLSEDETDGHNLAYNIFKCIRLNKYNFIWVEILLNLYLMIQMTIGQHWYWPGTRQPRSHYLNHRWPIFFRLCSISW